MKRIRIILPLFSLLIVMLMTLSTSLIRTEAQSFGSGWIGTYFNNTDLSGDPVVGVVDAQVNFAWGEGAPTGLQGFVNPDNFSVRWNSLEDFAQGIYRFTAGADDGIRVFIDGNLVIDNFGNTGAFVFTSVDLPISLGLHDLTVEYVEREGNAAVQFFWEAISTVPTETPGPSPTPTATGLPPIPPGSLTATVVRASVLNARGAPSLGGNVVGRLLRGQQYQVIGRDESAEWFLLQLSGFQGWAWGFYLFIDGNEFNAPVRSATTLFPIPDGFVDTGVIAQTRAVMKLRASPNVFSEQIGRVTWGGFVPVVGRTPNNDWYLVLWKGTLGWISTDFLRITQGDLNAVPIIQ